MSVPLLAVLSLLCACTTEAHRRAAEHAAVEKEAAQEVRRICALPPAERQAELAKISKDSGIVVQCGKD